MTRGADKILKRIPEWDEDFIYAFICAKTGMTYYQIREQPARFIFDLMLYYNNETKITEEINKNG